MNDYHIVQSRAACETFGELMTLMTFFFFFFGALFKGALLSCSFSANSSS